MQIEQYIAGRSIHPANEPIHLRTTSIIRIDSQPAQIPARVSHELFPQPRLVVECQAPPQILANPESCFRIVLASGEEMDVVLAAWNPGRFPGNQTAEDTLALRTQPCVTRDEGVVIHKTEFLVVNGLRFLGPHLALRKTPTSRELVGHRSWTTNGWNIELWDTPGGSKSEEFVRETKGHSISHGGFITRVDGDGYSSDDVRQLLRGIEVFLSFVRSQFCGIAIAQGRSKEDRVVWSRWGSPRITPGHRRYRWLRLHKSRDELEPAFSEFLRRYSEPLRGQLLANIMDWHMNTQESAVHVGLILSQAALESLSCYVLRRRKRYREPAGGFIHDAFVRLDIDSHVTVPGSLRHLST